MQRTIDETDRRRIKQISYNTEHGIIPKTIKKATGNIMSGMDEKTKAYSEPVKTDIAADPVVQYMSEDALTKAIEKTKQSMKNAAKDLDFIEAARLRDEMFAMEKLLKGKRH